MVFHVFLFCFDPIPSILDMKAFISYPAMFPSGLDLANIKKAKTIKPKNN